MGKVYYCFGILWDEEIPGTIPRNSTIPEELGRIQFLLTDKTGTLTKNDMIFKKLNLEYAAFDTETLPELRNMLVENCLQRKDAGPMSDLVGLQSDPSSSPEKKTNHDSEDKPVKRKKGGLRRDQSCVIRDLVTALALCHNVTPTFPNPENKNVVEYQASSPDEVALVKFAESLDMRLLDRDQN